MSGRRSDAIRIRRRGISRNRDRCIDVHMRPHEGHIMSDLIDIRDLIRRGAPANGDEARQIIRVALQNIDGPADNWEQRLSSALTEIMVGRQLHEETYKARAEALAVIDEINRRRAHPGVGEPRQQGS
jgi:hypothetical protein